ncbi:conserved hypothetical protein [Aster yellows witches'-broom phytoplasma AYWB]|uniref:YqaJ viral recombinase domain-containing protein n=1 Tax=Aster yellows witches'-broom phytoplasma (strain AYWB) TaxID=322098 RepID=Q2NJ90_AYWBP|nr:conserved hypothetical protein [Aster yellows witches'-broom phytoplasma AYWB]
MFSASLDGYNSKTNTLLEIKYPYVNENNTISTSWNGFLKPNKPHQLLVPSSMSTLL